MESFAEAGEGVGTGDEVLPAECGGCEQVDEKKIIQHNCVDL